MTTYGVIAADPPWSWNPWKNGVRTLKARSVLNHYQTMSLDAIKALPIQDLAAKHCVLFLWAIDTHLPEAMEVIPAWGFTFRTIGFVWAKTTCTGKYPIGCGWWTRANPELCLLATKGKPKPMAKDVRRLVISPRREHSRKPDAIYDTFIPRLCNGPYVELFARTRRPNWDVAFSNNPDQFPQEINMETPCTLPDCPIHPK